MWRLVNERVSARQKTKDQSRIWKLSRSIPASFKGGRKRRVETAGEEVEALLGEDPQIPREAWQQLKGWYKAAVDHALLPA